jgi:hypothetical protein
MATIPGIGHKPNKQTRNWMASVLTDVHFWVPLLVLVAGLFLLRYVR